MNHPKYARLVRPSVEPQKIATPSVKRRGISLLRKPLFLKPKFLRRALGVLILLVAVSWSFQQWIPPSQSFAAPWSPTHGSYGQRKQLTLVNNSGQTFESGTTYKVTIDTQAIYNTGSLLSSCDDLRVVYQPSSTTAVELKRNMEYASSSSGVTTCATSSATKVVFQLQANIANAGTDTNYYLYYDNVQATAYSSSDALDAYNVGAKEATFVVPFNGTTTALAAGSGTPTTATGAIRYSGGKSAMSFDGVNDSIAGGATASLTITDQITAEAWINPSKTPPSDGDYGITRLNSNSSGLLFEFRNTNKVQVWLKTQNNVWSAYASTANNSIPNNTWSHVATTYTSGSLKIFINGVQVATSSAVTGDIFYTSTPGYAVGEWGGSSFFPGFIDEVRISNTVRYTSNFTPSTNPFVRDDNTKLLLHFDENGDDPRNTGKALDDSGNGNHGTITGAKYVGGLVGVDGSTTSSASTGYQSPQAYAGHEGVFIEEGTTNKITNPSFENAIYDKNWSTNTGATAITTIATSTENRATSNNRVRKTWWDGTRYWASFDNGNDIVFYYSTNSSSWTQNSSATIAGKDYSYSIWGDGTDLYIAYVISLDVRVRKATSYPGTSFTWGTEYTVFDGTGATDNHFIGGITKDTSGYLWISATHYDGSNGQIYVKRSTSTNDVSAWNSTVQLSSSSGFTQSSTVVPLNNGDVYSLFSITGSTSLHGCYFDAQVDARWEASNGNDCTNGANYDSVGTDVNAGIYGFSATVDPANYDIHVVARKSSGTGLSYYRWDNGSGTNGTWQSGNDTGASITAESFSLSVDSDTGDLFLTYINGEPYLKKCDVSAATSECSTAGDWSSATDLGSLTSGTYVNSNFSGPSRVFSLWRDNSGSPYDVEFISLQYPAGTVNTAAPYYKFGSKSVKIDATSSTVGHITLINAGNINTHTLSAYIYNGTSGALGGTVDATVAKLIFNGTAQTTTYTDMGGGWWRLKYSAAAGTGLQDYGIEAQSGKIIYGDGVQLEEQAYATTYTDGTMGTGYAWTGTANDSTSTRTTTDLTYSSTNNVSTTEGTVSMWFRPNMNYLTGQNLGSKLMTLFSLTGGSGSLKLYWVTNGTGTWRYEAIYSNGGNNWVDDAVSDSLTMNEWDHLVIQWSSSGVRMYKNNVPGALNSTTLSYTSPTGVAIGYGGSSTYNYLNGVSSDFKIYSSALTSTEVADLYYSGLGSHSSLAPVATERYTDGEPPVLAWHLNEGYGITTYDSTIYQNSGTINGATWSEDSAQAGMTGSKSLKFDGVDDKVSRAYSNDPELAPGTSPFSVSTWFKHPSTVSGTDTLISRYSSTGSGGGYKVYMNSSGNICFAVDDDTTWGPDDSACTTVSYADSNWHHVLAIKGTSTIAVYIDGTQKASTAFTVSSSLSGSSPTFYTGIDSDGTSNPWDGFIDEVRVYNSVRSEEQINQEYVAKGTNKGVSAQFGSGGASDTLSQGLVGHWKMDEASWNGTAGEVLDASGNGNNGTSVNGATTASGKYGNGGSFDGTGDYATIADSSSLDSMSGLTLSTWIYLNQLPSTNYVPLGKDSTGTYGYRFVVNSSGTPHFVVATDNNAWYSTGTVISAGSNLSSTTWYQLTGVYDGRFTYIFINGQLSAKSTSLISGNIVNSASVVSLGRAGDNTYQLNGKIDDARIYNRALSPVEVRALYEYAPGPVAHYTFDDGSGQSTYDKSGNSNTGTLGASASPASDDPQWTNGKYGKALSFDGTDDYAFSSNNIGISGSAPRTLEFWVKNNDANNRALIGWGASGGSVTGSVFQPLIWGGKYYLHLLTNDWDTGVAPQTGVWVHHSIVYDGTTVHWYVNGADVTTPVPKTLVTTDSVVSIGKKVNGAAGWASGSLDDVRIYNYARTQKQIVQDMNAGHPAVGSPVGSAVAHYKFDEGQGTVARNSGNGGSTLNGTLTNMSAPATSTSGWTNDGKFNKALNFDGGDDYINIPNSSAVDIRTNISISLWVKPTGVYCGSGCAAGLVAKNTAASNGGLSYVVEQSPTGKISLYIDNVGNGFTPQVNTWTLALFTYDGSTVKSYMNGILQTTTAKTGSITSTADPLIIGKRLGGAGRVFNGSVDEVKIYNYALSEDEVKLEYNQGKAIVMGSLGTTTDGKTASNAKSRAYCPPGNIEGNCAAGQNPSPVAEWNFDDPSVSSGQSAVDTSGNNNAGQLGSTSGVDASDPAWVAGKQGEALSFDGSDDYTTVADSNSLHFGTGDFTVTAWIKTNKNSPPNKEFPFLSKTSGSGNNGFLLETHTWGSITGDQINISCYFTLPGPGYQACGSFGTRNINQWNHVTMQRVGTTVTLFLNGVNVNSTTHANLGINLDNSALLKIGGQDIWGAGSLYRGIIDQVRIYNYARTPAQIAWDYNKGAPLVQYKFNECSGTTINNSVPSANGEESGNNGTLIIGATLPQTSAGTCSSGNTAEAWNNGTTGKLSSSISFDGVDDYAQTGDLSFNIYGTAPYSQSVWVKTSTKPTSGNYKSITMTTETGQGSTTHDKGFVISSSGYASFYNWTGTQNFTTGLTDITDNNWHHLTATYDGTNCRLYVDGKLERTQAVASTYQYTSPQFVMSFNNIYNFQYYSGQVDDARIYNYALSPVQVRDVYNNGAVSFK